MPKTYTVTQGSKVSVQIDNPTSKTFSTIRLQRPTTFTDKHLIHKGNQEFHFKRLDTSFFVKETDITVSYR